MFRIVLTRLDNQEMREECGIFAVHNSHSASYDCLLGLHALQHRGQEAAGIAVTCDNKIIAMKEKGELRVIYRDIDLAQALPGVTAVGHVRYSTSGSKTEADYNIQPILGTLNGMQIAIAHNGNFVNIAEKKRCLQDECGVVFKTTMDTEVFLHLLIQSKQKEIIAKIKDVLSQIEGAYSMIIMYDNQLIAFRDAYGVRPLVIGEIPKSERAVDGGTTYFIASETCALDIVGAKYLCNVETGKVAIINCNRGGHLLICDVLPKQSQRFCLFEYIYFLRPDSIESERPVYKVRKQLGRTLAKESPADADIVIAVPDSGIPAALGFAEVSGLPFEAGITRNHYVGRTFILPTDESRINSLGLKHNPNRCVIENKRVVVVDDSIVRGNTLKKIVEMIKGAGAAEIHIRIASPEMKFSCFYGVDTPERSKLISNKMKERELESFFNVDSLRFLSLDGLYKSVCNESRNSASPQFCDACLTGDYFIAKDFIKDSQG